MKWLVCFVGVALFLSSSRSAAEKIVATVVDWNGVATRVEGLRAIYVEDGLWMGKRPPAKATTTFEVLVECEGQERKTERRSFEFSEIREFSAFPVPGALLGQRFERRDGSLITLMPRNPNDNYFTEEVRDSEGQRKITHDGCSWKYSAGEGAAMQMPAKGGAVRSGTYSLGLLGLVGHSQTGNDKGRPFPYHGSLDGFTWEDADNFWIEFPKIQRITFENFEKPGRPSESKSGSLRATPGERGSFPPLLGELRGNNEVRVRNPNEFGVSVGVRAEGTGTNFDVPANGRSSAYLPNGRYDIYFVYSNEPSALYQGDSFELADNGVEIDIVKVSKGNYAIRRIK